PLKIILLNNGYLGMVRQWQELFFDARYSFTELQNPDFIKIVEAYEITALRVEKREQLAQAIHAMLAANGPFFLEIAVEKQENVFPMMPAGAAVDEVRLF